MRAVKGLLSLAVGFAVSSALAADWFIPDGDLVALTNAFTQLAAGDTVTLAKGTYDFSAHPEIYMSLNTGGKYATVITNRLAINSKQNITLRGEPGASRDEVIVNGGSARLLYINGSSQSGLVVTNLTLTNFAAGYKASEGLGDTAAYRGSVIHSSKGTTIADCVIRDCKAGYAALYGAGIVCRDSVLTNCVGSSYSGAAVLGTYYNCRFIGNSNESGSGGAAAQISASNCWFEANVAAISGGAVLGGTVVNAGSAGSSCILEDCVFTNNTANGVTSADKGQLGGGAYATTTFNPTKKDVYPDIFRRCHFYGNSAEVGGAVLTGSGSKSTTTDSVVPASFADCDFSGNEAGKRGGAAAEGFYIAKDAAEDAQRGLTISNCTFSANVVTGGLFGGNKDESTGFANITGGGALFGANAVDSTFEDCSAVYFGGAVIGGSFIGCTFTGNGVTVASSGRNYGGGVGYRIEFASNCTFRANGRNAGAITGELLLNCKEFHLTVFQDNMCTNRGWGLVCSSLPGMSFTDCTFTNSPNNRGGATIENDCPTSRAQLVRCKFFDCLQPKYDGLFGGTDDKINGWAAYGCDAVDCFFGDGALETVSGDCGCSATRCVFQGIAPTRAAIFYGNAGRIALTNCLICNCVAAPGAATFRNVDLVNCTVVGNTYNDGFRLTNSVVNCILSGNTRGGEASDLYHRIHADSLLMVQNCVYGINSQTLDVSSFADLGGCVALGTASPGFNLDKNPNFPYYSLRRSSRACRAGTNAAAFAGTVDLAGNPRVHGEGPYTVDAGCYECWIPPMGLLLLFR